MRKAVKLPFSPSAGGMGTRVGEVCILAGMTEHEFSRWRSRQHIRHGWREAAIYSGLSETITIPEVRLAFRQAARFVHG